MDAVLDRREFKRLIQRLSRALRDSEGGGIMERFEAVSKLLFTKVVDEREAAGGWNGLAAKDEPQLRWLAGDIDRTVYERTREVWHRAISAYPAVFSGSRSRFPRDVPGVARIVRLLEPVSLSGTPADVKGTAYEELLRNTFEKDDNQQYFTPRHVVDFMVEFCGPTVDDTVCDPAGGSGGFLVGALAHAQRSGADIAGFASRLRGAELDERMAWVARINMLLHGGSPTSIFHLTGAGSLAPSLQIRKELPSGSFSLILTNPPFGSDMADRAALDGLKTGRGRSTRRRGILFVERCLELLAPGGRLAIVLDDSVLNLPANSDIREIVRTEAIVEAVVSLPDVTFMPYSTAKSSILVVRKRVAAAERQGPVFMADVEHVGNRPNGDPLYSDERDADGARMLRSDLPHVLRLFEEFSAGSDVNSSFEGTAVFAADVEQYAGAPGGDRLDVFFFHPARQHAAEQLARSPYPLVRLGDLVDIDSRMVKPSEEYGDTAARWVGLGDIEALTGRFDVKEITGDRIKSNARVFRAGDILFSRLRPKLRKVVRIADDDEGGLCSAELFVMRRREVGEGSARRIDGDFLAYLLRSELAYGQQIYQITGIGRPRVGTEAVRNLRFPVPPLRDQRRLLRELKQADRDADALRAEAQRKREEARRRLDDAFEHAITVLCPPGQLASSPSVGVGPHRGSAIGSQNQPIRGCNSNDDRHASLTSSWVWRRARWGNGAAPDL